MLNTLAVGTQILLFFGVAIYVWDTFRWAGTRREATPQVLPIVTWVVVLPIIFVCISQTGEFASSAYASFPVPASAPWERDIIAGFVFVMALLCLSVFILGFARCIYTVNLLDLDHWWAVERFRSRCMTGRYANGEVAFRTLVAVSFGYHQTTILNFLGCFSGTQGEAYGMRTLREISLFLQKHLNYTAFPQYSDVTEGQREAAVELFCISGFIVFLFMLGWTCTVFGSVRATRSTSALDERDTKNLRWQLWQQLGTSVAGMLTMFLLWLIYKSGSMPSVFILGLLVMLLVLAAVICLVFVPNLWGILKPARPAVIGLEAPLPTAT